MTQDAEGRTPNEGAKRRREEPSFEQRVARLEHIAKELERDNIELSRALELFEEGVGCLREATAELSKAEVRVQQLIERMDGTFETIKRGE